MQTDPHGQQPNHRYTEPRFPVSTTPNDHRNAGHTIHRQFHHQRFEEFSRGEHAAEKGLVDGEKRGDELDGEKRGVYRGIWRVKERLLDNGEINRVKLPQIQPVVELRFILSSSPTFIVTSRPNSVPRI